MASKSMEKCVDLGFTERCQADWRLLSHYFPSKLGGPPAWLSFDLLPDCEAIKCSNCEHPCKFLLQIYSPGSDVDHDHNNDHEEQKRVVHIGLDSAGCDILGAENADALFEKESKSSAASDADHMTFHRTIFLFVCDQNVCVRRSIKCFRSQLHRQNKFYSSQPPNEKYFDESVPYPKATDYIKTCVVCNCAAPKCCSQCKKYYYCSREHQALHWRNGHKQECAGSGDNIKQQPLKYYFDEYEILIEPEKQQTPSLKTENEAFKEYEKYVGEGKCNKELDRTATKADWESAKEVKIADRAFMAFRERIASDPDQIIRYEKGGKPLLVSDESKPPKEVPNCEHCGGPRHFEFQVLPQALSYLHIDRGVDSLDWGTLLVYTCERSCEIKGYAPEFVWKQDFSNVDLVENK